MPSISPVRSLVLASILLLVGACAPTSEEAPPEAAPPDETSTEAPADTEPDGEEAADADAESPADAAAFPVTVSTDHGEVTLDEPAEAIVSLSPSTTEILYAIGAGEQVVAVDRHSDHPEGTPTTELSGFDPNVEAIADLGPDLVVASGDRNDIVDGLGALDIPVLVHTSATSLDDVTNQILSLGQLTDRIAEAEELATSLETRLDELAAEAPAEAEGLTYYHELSDGYYSATSETFVGQLYALIGLENIADDAPEAGDAGGFPQLAPEYVIEADPDLIFLAHDAELDDRPGWKGLTAVQNGHVIELDRDVASRWGPRIVEQVEAVLDAVTARVEAADAG